MFPTVTMCTQLRTLRKVATRLRYMILMPRYNDVIATSLYQSYYEKVHSRRQLYSFSCTTKLNFKEHVLIHNCVLECTNTAKNNQTLSWQVFSAVNFALEKLRNVIINAQTSSLRLFFQMQTTKNVKRTFSFLPNIGPISAVSEPTPLDVYVFYMFSCCELRQIVNHKQDSRTEKITLNKNKLNTVFESFVSRAIVLVVSNQVVQGTHDSIMLLYCGSRIVPLAV